MTTGALQGGAIVRVDDHDAGDRAGDHRNIRRRASEPRIDLLRRRQPGLECLPRDQRYLAVAGPSKRNTAARDDGSLREAGEERRLLAAAASPRLYNLIVGALETCCRRGELLSLQWRDLNLDRGELTIRGDKAKDGDTRVLPISARLSAVLKMAKTDPAGKDYKGDAFVFGELGQQVENIKRAWETCVLKAHGYEPTWQKTALAPASRAHLKAIDLHFHDLRHEGASRLLEDGWPLHHVQEMLGHASLEQTSIYLNVQRGGLRDSMRKSGAVPRRCNPG